MSQQDVELVRRIYEGFGAHRFPEELLDERFEWTTHPAMPDAGTYRRRDAVRGFFADWVAGWVDVHNEPRELIDTGDNVVVLVHGRFQLSESSPAFESDYGHVWTVREGMALSCESVELDQALALCGRR